MWIIVAGIFVWIGIHKFMVTGSFTTLLIFFGEAALAYMIGKAGVDIT